MEFVIIPAIIAGIVVLIRLVIINNKVDAIFEAELSPLNTEDHPTSTSK